MQPIKKLISEEQARNLGLTDTQHHAIDTIPFISDVDFVPYEDEVYASLPQPYRNMAREELYKRQENWASLVEDRKRSFE